MFGINKLKKRIRELERLLHDPCIGEYCLYGCWYKFKASDITDRIDDNYKIKSTTVFDVWWEGEKIKEIRMSYGKTKHWVKKNRIIFYENYLPYKKQKEKIINNRKPLTR